MKILLIFIMFLFLPLVFAANVEYTIVGEKVLVEIELNESELELFEFPEEFEYSENKVKYIDNNLIEKTGKDYFFIVKSEIFPYSSVQVILPEGAYHNEDYFIFPKKYELSTNGMNIILNWENSGEEEILVPYKINTGENYWIYAAIVLVVVLSIYFYFHKKGRKEKYTQNLFREEKEIMSYLLKNWEFQKLD